MVVLLFCISIIADTARFFKTATTLIFQKYFHAHIFIITLIQFPRAAITRPPL